MASSCSDSGPINLIQKIHNRLNAWFRKALKSVATKKTGAKSVRSGKSLSWSKDGESCIWETKEKNSTSKRRQKLSESLKKVSMIITINWEWANSSTTNFRNTWTTKSEI
jgi:hypothetical protein